MERDTACHPGAIRDALTNFVMAGRSAGISRISDSIALCDRCLAPLVLESHLLGVRR